MNPIYNEHGVYCPDQWESELIIGKNDYKEPHCHICIVKLDEDKWIGSTSLETNTMKCGVYGAGSYPGINDKIFITRDECIKYHSKELYGSYIRLKKEANWDGFNKIIDKLEELADLQPVKQLTLF